MGNGALAGDQKVQSSDVAQAFQLMFRGLRNEKKLDTSLLNRLTRGQQADSLRDYWKKHFPKPEGADSQSAGLQKLNAANRKLAAPEAAKPAARDQFVLDGAQIPNQLEFASPAKKR
ncbi:MAG: hypothetical protein ACXWPM_13160 [Bdellovibrionota bacterium]